jgi:putative membrane protein
MVPNRDRLRAADWSVIAITFFLVWSGIAPNDRIVWALEVFWVAIVIVMWAVWLRKHPVTTVTFTLVVIHCVILIVGGIYTYSKVPAGIWVQEWMGRPRNDYDRLGHFIQGFAPALVWREVFIRNAIVVVRGWLAVIVVGMCLAFSALFELFEFAMAVLAGEPGINFLGAQGDAWDAQWDMFFCFVGATLAVMMFWKLQDRQIAGARGLQP